MRRFGYADRSGIPDRLNFGGVYRIGIRNNLTGLKTMLLGYDSETRKITDATGAVTLVNDAGEIAAKWDFSGILTHWSGKHMKAVYVPSMRRTTPSWQYCYGNVVRLAKKTDSLRLLNAFATGIVYYDPLSKVENASTHPRVKPRNQFRIASRSLEAIYENVTPVEV